MKHIFSKTKALLMALCIGWMALATSCITEDLDGCYTLTVKVLNLNGDDITIGSAEDVKDVSVFIFDEAGKYLETVKMTSAEIITRTPIEINYPSTAKLQIVAWGNVAGNEQTLVSGQTIDDLKIQLKKTNDYADYPAELYFGDEAVSLKSGTLIKNEEVPIQLCVGKLQMWTNGLQYCLAANPGLRADEAFNFYFERGLDELNSKGEVQGSETTYAPEGALTVAEEWEMPELETVLPGEELAGSFYINGVFEQQSLRDYITDEELRVEAGKETLVEFVWGPGGEYLGVRIKVRPWGYIEEEIEW